jgi:PAS domain S-box-containing protein
MNTPSTSPANSALTPNRGDEHFYHELSRANNELSNLQRELAQKNAELTGMQATLRSVLDHLPQRVFWKDRDLIYRGCNQAFAEDMGFRNPDEVIGKTDFDAAWKSVADLYRADDRSVVESGAAKGSFEEPGVAVDGQPRWLKTSKIPLRDGRGQVTAVLGIYEDVTEHKLAKLEIERLNAELEARVSQRTSALQAATREAERANSAKSEFLSRMSHELRTPMNAILGFAQVLETEDGLSGEQRDSVGQILKGGSHLLKLINEVLDISGIESGRMTLSSEPVALHGVLDECLRLVGPLMAKTGVQLVAPSEDALRLHMQADRQRLKQVLLNLLSNAIKYNRPGGSVTIISTVCTGSEDGALPPVVRLSVTDTGMGLGPEQLARLFNPFDRLGAEQTRVEGTGLGLALARRMIEHMGGKLGVESVVGVGSTFWMELPRVEPPEEAHEEVMAEAALPPQSIAPTEKRVLLYIEDNPSNIRLITRILARRPEIELLCAETGALGLMMAREHCPDLILLDLHLPDSHGDEVLTDLRHHPRTAEIPVIMLTADAQPNTREHLLAAGARAFVTKPLEVRALLRTIDQCLTVTLG